MTKILDLIPIGSPGYGGIYLGNYDGIGIVIPDSEDIEKLLPSDGKSKTFLEVLELVEKINKLRFKSNEILWVIPTKSELSYVCDKIFSIPDLRKYYDAIKGKTLWTRTPLLKNVDPTRGYYWRLELTVRITEVAEKIWIKERDEKKVYKGFLLPIKYVFL